MQEHSAAWLPKALSDGRMDKDARRAARTKLWLGCGAAAANPTERLASVANSCTLPKDCEDLPGVLPARPLQTGRVSRALPAMDALLAQAKARRRSMPWQSDCDPKGPCLAPKDRTRGACNAAASFPSLGGLKAQPYRGRRPAIRLITS